MSRNFLLAATILLAANAAMAQQPIFDVDDFVDPRQHNHVPVFATRLVLGDVHDYVDDYRPLRQNVRFVHVANSVYWSNFQADYKHSEVRPEHAPPPVQVCNCDPPVYYPTPPLPGETPAPPPPAGRDTLQFAWYAGKGVKYRYRLTVSNQTINTMPRFPNGGTVAGRLHGRERSYGFEGDTPRLPFFGFGTLHIVRTVRTGTSENRAQSEFLYTSRFPGFAYDRVLFRGLFTVGGVSGRGARGINVVNPAAEAFWHDQTTRANFHLAWSRSSMRDGINGWRTHNQIALFVDRGVVFFRKR
jgi:hypothetical protein